MTFTEERLTPIAQRHGIDPVLIITIVMTLLQMCVDNSEEAVRRVRSIGPFQRAMLRVEFRRNTSLRMREITAVVRDLETEIEKASDEDIERVYSECCYAE